MPRVFSASSRAPIPRIRRRRPSRSRITKPPQELRDLEANLAAAEARDETVPPVERHGFARAAVDPAINALRTALARGRRKRSAALRARRAELVRRAAHAGPVALDVREQTLLLSDPELAAELHRRVWELPEAEAARWGRPGARFNSPRLPSGS